MAKKKKLQCNKCEQNATFYFYNLITKYVFPKIGSNKPIEEKTNKKIVFGLCDDHGPQISDINFDKDYRLKQKEKITYIQLINEPEPVKFTQFETDRCHYCKKLIANINDFKKFSMQADHTYQSYVKPCVDVLCFEFYYCKKDCRKDQ